ncbi:MAG: ABC transporter permease, partial [Gemmatimonadetes bacterium]|nr:ABC transporter permease [Gemmatimonadota bacterium]
MWRNYLKVAVRNLVRHRGYSAINISGLAVGMACAVLILLWVQDELSFDRFHKNAEALYRVEENQHYSAGAYHVNVTPFPAGPAFEEEIPEIVAACRYTWAGGLLFRYGEKAFFENDIRAVDPAFLCMFTFPLAQGDRETALDDPHSLILTREMAEKYFGDEEPIGKVISVDNQYEFTVTGIVEKVPENSSLRFSVLIPFIFQKERGWWHDHWGTNSIGTYVQLRPGTSIQAVEEKMTAIQKSHLEESTTDFVLA